MAKFIVNRRFSGSDGIIEASDKPVEISDDDAPGLLACGAISLPGSDAPEKAKEPAIAPAKAVSKSVKK